MDGLNSESLMEIAGHHKHKPVSVAVYGLNTGSLGAVFMMYGWNQQPGTVLSTSSIHIHQHTTQQHTHSNSATTLQLNTT